MGGSCLNQAKLRTLDRAIMKVHKSIDAIEKRRVKNEGSTKLKLARKKVKNQLFERKYKQRKREIGKFKEEILALAQTDNDHVSQDCSLDQLGL